MKTVLKNLVVVTLLVILTACGGSGGDSSDHGLFNSKPVASSATYSVDSSTIDIKLKATDKDGDKLSYKITKQPKHGKLSGKAPNLTYTPDKGFSGKDSFSYIASDGSENSNEATVTLNVVSSGGGSGNEEIEKLKTILNDPTVPYSTEADFNKTELGKSKLTLNEIKESNRAHILVATAKDPDPTWFATTTNNQVIVGKPGNSYIVTLKKVNRFGKEYSLVDNDKLRLVVRVQNSNNSYKYIRNIDVINYAQWISKGKLKISIPSDLEKGRLLIGLRPNFSDEPTNAISERWSIVLTAEVWNLKPNTKEIEVSKVLFPLDIQGGFDKNCKFSKKDIKDSVEYQFKNNQLFTLPIIVKDFDLKNNDLITYKFMNKPYAGRVIKTIKKNNQTLALLAPEYKNVYDITDFNGSSLQGEGLYPKHVIYREGKEVQTDVNRSDPINFQARYTFSGNHFETKCKRGTSPTLTIEPKFVLSPKLDAGFEIGYTGISGDVECYTKATTSGIVFKPPLYAGGIIAKLFGTEAKLSYYGESKIKASGFTGFGIKAGWTYLTKGTYSIISPLNFLKLGDTDISKSANAAKASVEVSSAIGNKFELNAISPDGWIGNIYSLFSDNKTIKKLGVEVKVGPKVYAVTEAWNAREVYNNNNSSSFAFGIGVEASLNVDKTSEKVLDFFGIDFFHGFKINVKVINIKEKTEFTFDSITDNGDGIANINGLKLKSPIFRTILSNPLTSVLSPENKISSVFNDKGQKITYDKDDCNDNNGIESKVIGCSGWMCGLVDKKVNLCKTLSISDTITSARVGKTAYVKSTIVNNAGDISVKIEGDPLKPQTQELDIKSGSSEEVVFKKVCPNRPGVYRKKNYLGKSTVAVEGTNLSAESLNILTCYKDENKGDPHITTSDGLGYDYFASGDYVLSRILDENGTQVSGYEIQARFLPGFKTSWPQAVALNVGGDRVEIQGRKTNVTGMGINYLVMWVNGEKVDLGTYSGGYRYLKNIIKLPSGGIIAITGTISRYRYRFGNGATIIWPEGSAAENYGLVVNVADAPNQPFIETLIARPDDFAGQERGLLGNNDGNPKNDFIRRNGEVLGVDHNMSFTELYALFGADWLVRPYESLFRNPEAIKPQFPTDVVTLTPEQRALGEEACRALTGFYREACIMDVGLTGSAEIVKEYYANTEDLNELSDAIVVPDVDRAHYTMNVGNKSYEPDSGYYYLHYKQNIDISHTAGEGKFMLLVRPPRGATVVLGTGESSHTGEGNFSTTLEVDCTQQNSSTDSEFFQKDGAVQLWLQDPLSGTTNHLVSQEPLVCTDASKRAGFSLSLGVQEEKADSNDTNLHYTRTLGITHTNSYAGEYILALTAPSNGAVLNLNGSSTELNVTGSSDYNASIELDCTQVVYDANYTNGSIKLWEKDKLSGQKAYLYSSVSLPCKKGKVLKTGQTVSYADFDDGYYQKGEERSYSRDNNKEIVTDNVIGLMWQDNAEARTVTKPWVTQANYKAGNYNDISGDTATTHCANLTLGGYSDWRLPTSKELGSIVNFGEFDPSINTAYFQNVRSSYYWSSTTDVGYENFAWYVHFQHGGVHSDYKNLNYHVRCVRVGQ